MTVMDCLSSASKKYGPMTPLDQTAHQTVTLGQKGGSVEKFSLLTVMQMKMCFIAHHKVVWQVWIFSLYSMKLITKL